jgi:hypothetical protein
VKEYPILLALQSFSRHDPGGERVDPGEFFSTPKWAASRRVG